MTPEQQTEFNKMKQTLETIEKVMSVEFIESMKLRLNDSYAQSGTSAKTAGSATQAVDEASTGTYNVMKPPSGFIDINGKNVPYIN